MTLHPSRMALVQTPIIPVVADLIRRHPGTISLGQGVVYYAPPQEAIAQISEFLNHPANHRYQAVEGIAPLRMAIATKLKGDNGMDLSDRDVVVTAGSNMGFLNAILAITQPGDEIILLTPYFFNQEMAITIAGCRPVLVPTDANYQPQPEAIGAAISDRTRAVVTISPNNPTGAVYSEAVLRKINHLCRAHNLYHISDEAYEYFTYDRAQHFSPGAIADSPAHTISLYTLSKAYGLASWRIGYMVIPSHLLTAVMKIQDSNVICPPVISQYAALGALDAGATYCRDKLGAIAEVRQLILHQLKQINHLCTISSSEGAFYLFLKIHTQMDSLELVERLIREHRVAVIPGNTFGMEDGCYVRVAYGDLQKETAVEGIDRLIHGLKTILNS
ncbi:MAG: pyridoxal phosphate-dependent aminotransferase [Cyanobacteria bacterium CRU_2_1]|nr:pyridoxal phosphate-dependent aminotransferase [Cyanobacteria bacterium CRU_2_1]